MRTVTAIAIAALICGVPALAADLNLSVESGGASVVNVAPGATVDYQIVGTLSTDADNEGLALFGLTLTFDGGALGAAYDPTTGDMLNFTRPDGITNPDTPCPPACGFGGTIIGGDLVQVGGGQNTINNTAANAPFPIGSVAVGVAHAPIVLVEGSLTAPVTNGAYTLSIPPASVFANVIRLGETGTPFWAVDAAGVGSVASLTINVGEPCQALSWESVATHGGVGEVGLEIPADGSFSEPRVAGLNKLVVTYDCQVSASAATVLMNGCTAGGAVDLSGITPVAVVGPGGDTVEITFEDGGGTPTKLPGSDFVAHVPAIYEITLDGVTTVDGVSAISADARVMRAILGDSFGIPLGTGDFRVNAGDNGFVRSFAAAGINPIDPGNPQHVRSDAFTDGVINAGDNGLVRSMAAEGLNGAALTLTCP